MNRISLAALLAVVLILGTAFKTNAQLVAIDTTKPIVAPEIVVTATRTAKALEQVPVPVTIISAAEIETQAITRVSDLLASELGFKLEYSRFGAAGVQLHGLDASYTLILLDGEPLMKNVDGFADISRIPAASIERIEITHGPSSSLYGSEALAGVVNIITKRSSSPISTMAQIQYGTNTTLDIDASVQTSGERGSAGIFVNRYSSDGYDLRSELPGQTAPPLAAYNVTGRGDYQISESVTVRGTGVVSTQDVNGVSALQNGGGEDQNNEGLFRLDWNLAPGIVFQKSSIGRITLTSQIARSKVDASYDDANQPELQDFLDFDQLRSETELQFDRILGTSFMASSGVGLIAESVEADFIAGLTRSATSGYAFGQLEWVPTSSWDVIGSFRVDGHPDYATQLNPKIALSWKGLSKFRFQASVGRGYKAPTFEQRYLNFVNPLAGSYTVLGNDGLADALEALDRAGVVKELLVDVDNLSTIAPESSWSYMAGFDYTPWSDLSIRTLLFHNDVTNLIETQVIGVATSGSNIFTYVNLGNVFTRGFQVDADFVLSKGILLGAGYEYLDARSEDLDAQLGGRSPHSARLKVQGHSDALGANAYVQALYRSSYPFITGVGLTVDESVLLDVVATKNLTSAVSLTGGVRNLLDFTAPAFLPEQPGRLLFAQLSVNY